MAESSLTGRKHCRKRRYCSLLAISSFSTMFSKDLNSRHIKTVLVWRRDAEKFKIDALIYRHSRSLLWLLNSLQHDPEKKIFLKQCGKLGKCWLVTSIFPFPTVFSRSTLLRASLNCGLHLFCHALNVDETKILSFGKELNRFNPCSSENFRLFQAERFCRRQFSIRWKWHKLLLQARKHCGKRRNSSLRAIPSFPQCFPKTYIADTWKLGLFWERVNCDL